MRRDSNQQKIAIAVGIALSAGMFSIVPVAYGAPVGGTVTTGGASIAYSDAANGGKDTSITSTTMNNVIDWQDFSVAKGEKVVFDGGTKDPTQGAHNYMNIVSGMNTSQIDGAIKGGNKVYIINPNGVIFGETASVDVGSLYASTRYVSSAAAVAAATAGDMTTVLADTSAGVATDVVNLGTINATNVVMEGQNVRFVNDSTKTNDGGTNVAAYQTTGVTASSVTLKADTADGGYIHVGNVDGSDSGYTGQSLTTNGEASVVNHKLVNSSNWKTTLGTGADVSGNYMLTEDIDASSISGFKTISSFSGSIDGNLYAVKKVTGNSGLFASANNATIMNLGIKDSTLSASEGDIGAFITNASNTTLVNVYNDNANIINANDYSAGLVSVADGITIKNSYSTGNITNESGTPAGVGLVGSVQGDSTNSVVDSYSTGNTFNGLMSGGDGSATITFERTISRGTAFHDNYEEATIKNSVAIGSEQYRIADSSGNESDIEGTLDLTLIANFTDGQNEHLSWSTTDTISNTGGVTINESTGAVTRPTWRIYEGQSTPVLTSQLKGITTVSYDYTHGSQSGQNYAVKTDSAGNKYKVGADLTAASPVKITNSANTTSDGVLTYNGSYMNVDENTLNYGGGANTSLISYSETGTTGVRNAKTKALFYSAQNGYDIVGGNVTMAKRQVTVEGTDLDFSHVYDGEKDVTKEFKTAFSASAGTGTAGGILTDDAAYVKLGYSSDFSAQFTDKKVENDKTIKLTGSLTLETQKDSSGEDVSGAADILDNYVLADSSRDLSTTTVKGSITARPIYLKVTEPTDDRLNKTYDGTNAVNSTVSASDIFSLDGTTYDKGTQNPGYGKIKGDTVTLKVGTATPVYVDVDDAGTVTTDDAANARTHKILFSGIELDGADASNYKLQYSDTHNDVSNSQAFLDGVIRPRLLASDGFQVKTQTGVDTNNNPIYEIKAANKVYDGTSIYKVPDNAVLVANTAGTDSNTGVIAADTNNLWFKLSSDTTKKSYFMDSSNAETDMAAGDKAAVKVAYAVDVATADGYDYLKGNYTFDEDTADGTATTWKTLNEAIPAVTGKGTISRRAITVAADGVTGIDKPYDGNAKVVGTGYTTMGGQYLKYAADTTAKLLADDNSATATDNASWDITASYSDKNVARNADNSVANKTVNFTVAITGDDAVNYTLNGGNAENASVTLTGTGKITPLDVTPVFTAISKTYNGTNKINDSDATSVTLASVGSVTGLTYEDTNGDSVTDDVSLAFSSGHSESDAYYVSEDYNGNAGENLAVYYPYLTLAGDDKGNYNLSTTTGTGTGTINRRLILSDSFTVDGNEATKVYDGDEYYILPDGATLTSAAGESGNTGVITADQSHLHFSLSDTANSTYFTKADGTTHAKNVADAKKISYAVNAAADNGYEYLLGNYKLGTEDSAVNLDDTSTELSVSGDGHITRRELKITAENATGIDKPYDTNDTVLADYTGIGNKVKYADGSPELVSSDGTAWKINASYNGADVYRDDSGQVVENGKEVTFTAYLSGDAANNYTINGTDAETYTQASPYELAQKGKGTINPLTITPVFKKITKTYTGTEAITDGNAYIKINDTDTVNVSDFTDNDSRLYTLPENLDGTNVTLKYSTDVENAFYDGAGYGAHTITYKGLSLEGTKSGNYELSSTTITGDGQINKATIGMSDLKFTFADVKREYNGDTAVGNNASDFVTDAYIDFGDGNNAVKFTYTGIDSAVYSSAGTGTSIKGVGTGKSVTYTISGITVPASVLANFEWDGNDPFTSTKSYTEDGVGTITPKTVYAKINNPTVTKTYNASDDVQINGSPVTGAALVNIMGLVGGSQNTSSAIYTDVNHGEDKAVEYTISVSDGENYNIYYGADTNAGYYTMGYAADGSNIISTVTTPNNVITQRDLKLTFGDVAKEYDSTTSVLSSQVAPGFDTVQGNDNISLTSYKAVYNSPNVTEANTVYYTNITISGNEAGNYKLVDSSGNAVTATSTVTGAGAITPLNLSGDLTFTLGDVTKEYNNDIDVQFTGKVGEDTYYRDNSTAAVKNYITAPKMTVNGINQQMGYELYSAKYDNNDASVGTHAATFQIGIRNTNYNMSNVTVNGNSAENIGANGVYYFNLTKDNATITPRRVYVSLDTTPEIKKTYDGDTGVEQDVTNMIIVRDGDLLNDGTRLNRNASVINAQYDTKDAGNDKTVTYQVRLTGNGADNYEIHRLENLGNDTADIVYSTLEGRGKIDKATLTFNPDDHAFDRDYRKGDANVGLNAGSVVLTGVNGETVTLNDGALNNVTAEFGKGTGANDFTADENVSWNGDNVVDKDIRFTGLDNALQYMVDNNVDTISKNYTIDGTAYFAAAKAKGKIKPITITQAATENWKAVTREYNADTDLQEVYDYSGATAEPLGINDILTFTLTHDGNTVTDSNGNALTVTYTAAGKYDDQNVGDNHTLNYHINSVETKVKDAASNANYILDDSVLTALVNHDVDSGAANNAGNVAVYSHITPRQLNAAVVKDSGNRKIYDGNDRADTSNFVVDADDQAILSKDGLLNDVVITARYGDKHASVNPGEADSNSKTITYTLALNDNSGNYAIATPSAAAQGDIERRKVYVYGTNAVAAPKDYDGNTDLPSGTDYNAMGFGLRDADSTTGLVTGDSDLKLDATQVEGHYVSPDVKRATDGSVIAQNINFSGFKLNDTDSTNDNSINDYVVIDAGGSGVIKPLPVSVSIAAAPYKVYDGTTTVKGTAAANANLVPSGLLTGDSANILIGSADYDDASAGTNKGYTYNITLGNGNYTLVQGSNAPEITVTGNGLKGQIKASDGTIDKRTITPTVNGIMTKVYDGTTAGTENAAANISLGNVLSGENVGLTAKAVYDNPNAGKSEDSDELQNHRVTYTLNLSNPNYQLADDTVTGTGTISRKGLNIVATPVSINNGEAMPKFSGTVEGLVSGDENLTSSFVFDTLPTVTNVSVGSNPVYGWYRNSYDDGNLGLNYTYQQAPANATAFTVNYVDSGRNNPDTKITPTHNVYQQISKDKGSGFGDNAAAALEYVDKNGQVIARETIDSGEIHDGSVSLGNADDMTSQDTSLANIGIVGGDIVNVDGADAANMANIEVTDNGTTVNLEITSLSSGESGDKQAVAEITSVPAAADNSSAQIQNLDGRQEIVEQLENKDKDEEKKDSEIAIESPNNQNDDEIELKIEGSGVKVA